jgi:hypothetical protein
MLAGVVGHGALAALVADQQSGDDDGDGRRDLQVLGQRVGAAGQRQVTSTST